MALSKPPTKLQVNLIRASLLSAWQTAAAIAQHAGVPARTAVTVLKAKETEWQLETRMVRVDGHNEVRMVRQRVMVKVMGVTMPQAEPHADFEETET